MPSNFDGSMLNEQKRITNQGMNVHILFLFDALYYKRRYTSKVPHNDSF